MEGLDTHVEFDSFTGRRLGTAWGSKWLATESSGSDSGEHQHLGVPFDRVESIILQDLDQLELPIAHDTAVLPIEPRFGRSAHSFSHAPTPRSPTHE